MSTSAIGAILLADGDGWHGHMDWGGGWLMLVWGLFMLVPLVALSVWVVRTTGVAEPPDRSDEDDGNASGRRILAERYARGVISTDEYRERSAELG